MEMEKEMNGGVLERELFLDEGDIIHQYDVDEEDSPADDDDHIGADADMVAGDNADDDSIHLFVGHEGPILTVACSPTNTTLVATGGEDDMGFLWNIGQDDQPQKLLGHTDSVTSLAFSADGNLLASGSFDGSVQIWDINCGSLKCTLTGPTEGIEWVRWHPRGHLVLAGSEDFTVWLWNADKVAFLNTFSGHEGSVTCGDFTPDGKKLCTGSVDASLRIWDPRKGEKIHIVKGHPYHTKQVTCLTISYDSTLAITGSEDNSVHIVNIVTGKVVSSLLSHLDSVECVGLSPSVPWVATGALDLTLIVWDMQHATPRCVCVHEADVTCLQWLGASQYIATGCVDGKILVWDSLSGNCMKKFSGHTANITSLSVSSNGGSLVSGSMTGEVRVFEIADFLKLGRQDIPYSSMV